MATKNSAEPKYNPSKTCAFNEQTLTLTAVEMAIVTRLLNAHIADNADTNVRAAAIAKSVLDAATDNGDGTFTLSLFGNETTVVRGALVAYAAARDGKRLSAREGKALDCVKAIIDSLNNTRKPYSYEKVACTSLADLMPEEKPAETAVAAAPVAPYQVVVINVGNTGTVNATVPAGQLYAYDTNGNLVPVDLSKYISAGK